MTLKEFESELGEKFLKENDMMLFDAKCPLKIKITDE